MGNCLKHQSSPKYASDDDRHVVNFPAAEGDSPTTDAKATTTEVKIKITKKQLEELLSKVDVRELRVEQVLAQLMNQSGGGYQSLQRPWRPALQSIPEMVWKDLKVENYEIDFVFVPSSALLHLWWPGWLPISSLFVYGPKWRLYDDFSFPMQSPPEIVTPEVLKR